MLEDPPLPGWYVDLAQSKRGHRRLLLKKDLWPMCAYAGAGEAGDGSRAPQHHHSRGPLAHRGQGVPSRASSCCWCWRWCRCRALQVGTSPGCASGVSSEAPSSPWSRSCPSQTPSWCMKPNVGAGLGARLAHQLQRRVTAPGTGAAITYATTTVTLRSDKQQSSRHAQWHHRVGTSGQSLCSTTSRYGPRIHRHRCGTVDTGWG